MADEVRKQAGELDHARVPMEVVCGEFVEAVATALAEFWPGYIDECIAENGPRLTSMSDKAIAALKGAVDGIVADPRPVCHREIVDRKPERWPHLVPTEDLIERVRGSKTEGLGRLAFSPSHSDWAPPALAFAVECAVGAVALPFHMAGLATPAAIIDEEGCRVAFSSSWTEEMNDASERYSRLVLTMEGRARELAAAIDLRDNETIKDRWKQA
ncbi:MAG TPA: hypothetical protein VK480_03855 [Solirubrobacterales bacterium]|nr:hypothetical protein [Solirubrobacterales bacterium]